MESILVAGKKADEQEYPCLKIIVGGHGATVLFSGVNTGTVVHDTSGSYTVGHFSEDWACHLFEVFEGAVTLSN